MYNASDRKDIRRAEKAAKHVESSRVEFIRAALSTPQGRIWFHQLLSACHIFSTTFNGNALNAAFAEGERNVGLMVYGDIVTHCPDEFVRMMREAQAREIEDGRRTDHSDPTNSLDDTAFGQLSGGADAGRDVEEPPSPGWDRTNSLDYTKPAK